MGSGLSIRTQLPLEARAREVTKVKRSANGIILDPLTLGPDDTVARAKELIRTHNVSWFPVTEDGSANPRGKGKVLGIITRRDLKFVDGNQTRVADVMTSQGLITAPAGTTLGQAELIAEQEQGGEADLLVDDQGRLTGLITMRDIERLSRYPKACAGFTRAAAVRRGRRWGWRSSAMTRRKAR